VSSGGDRLGMLPGCDVPPRLLVLQQRVVVGEIQLSGCSMSCSFYSLHSLLKDALHLLLRELEVRAVVGF
jgi:hypothetical protein